MQEVDPAEQENQEQEDVDMDSGNGPGEAIDLEMPDVNDDTNDISPGKPSSCSHLSSLNIRAYEILSQVSGIRWEKQKHNCQNSSF